MADRQRPTRGLSYALLALVLAAAQKRTAEALRAAAPTVKRWGGRILVLVGVWFLILGVFADEFAGVFAV